MRENFLLAYRHTALKAHHVRESMDQPYSMGIPKSRFQLRVRWLV
jgi:hypothetical protein